MKRGIKSLDGSRMDLVIDYIQDMNPASFFVKYSWFGINSINCLVRLGPVLYILKVLVSLSKIQCHIQQLSLRSGIHGSDCPALSDSFRMSWRVGRGYEDAGMISLIDKIILSHLNHEPAHFDHCWISMIWIFSFPPTSHFTFTYWKISDCNTKIHLYHDSIQLNRNLN